VSPDQRFVELNLELPTAPPGGTAPKLRPVVVHGDLAFCSGNGDGSVCGYVGSDVSVDEARAAARTAAHLLCRALRDELGTLDRVERWIKVLALVRSAPGFSEQPQVVNGFTEAIAELWGDDRGVSARSAIGVAELPGGMAVEVEAIVALEV
jgi:enamine deaminase RidA (YjgF/YER057c/UK114 family)